MCISIIFGIKTLVDRSLLTIGPTNKLMMHPLLLEMGRDVVRQESPNNPRNHSHLCCHEESNGWAYVASISIQRVAWFVMSVEREVGSTGGWKSKESSGWEEEVWWCDGRERGLLAEEDIGKHSAAMQSVPCNAAASKGLEQDFIEENHTKYYCYLSLGLGEYSFRGTSKRSATILLVYREYFTNHTK
nr:hypothetical protein [Tanacetum cinerariifolium]